MAGLQEVAAIIGVAEVAFRSISSLYDFFRNLKHVPKEIEAISRETRALQQCLSDLGFLLHADKETHAAVRRTGLPQAITNCGEACTKLRGLLYKWTATSKYNLLARIQFQWDRRLIDNVISEIGNAKQTAILSVVITQMSTQLRSSAGKSIKKREPAISKAPMMPTNAGSPKGVVGDGQKESESVVQVRTSTEASQTWKDIEVNGQEDCLGIGQVIVSSVKVVKQEFGNVSTTATSKRNKIGMW
ncbi:hypothetical protein BGZ60DRAFT_562108 [Tricladium varicosporioides]|nr:hypothetical protein BGZ60DRAFT_562108 [Hymenoscyphus varicosporioides]